MAVELNHIIVPARDRQTSAVFLAGILGVEVGPPFGPFAPVRLANGATLDFEDAANFEERHCAFLVDEAEFDSIHARIQASGVKWYADPFRNIPGEVNQLFGGRGVYFDDPDGHLMEVLTWVIPHPYWQALGESHEDDE
jgi:catechol 2,3-dioxygenase-like lactoylglutathione lyase family enzyme